MESYRRSEVGLTEMSGSIFPDVIRSNYSKLKIVMEAWWTHSYGCFLDKTNLYMLNIKGLEILIQRIPYKNLVG